MLLDLINSSRSEEELKKDSNENILILVPNGLVSIIIGSKGKSIRDLIRESEANIVVNQPVYKMLHRTISISGKTLYL